MYALHSTQPSDKMAWPQTLFSLTSSLKRNLTFMTFLFLYCLMHNSARLKEMGWLETDVVEFSLCGIGLCWLKFSWENPEHFTTWIINRVLSAQGHWSTEILKSLLRYQKKCHFSTFFLWASFESESFLLTRQKTFFIGHSWFCF